MRRGRPLGRRALTWDEAASLYQSYLKQHRGLSANSCRSMLREVSHFVAFAREQMVLMPSDCSLQTVDRWVERVAGGRLAQQTLKSYLSAVRLFLKFLHVEGHLAEDVSQHLEGPRLYQEASVPEHMPWPEMVALLDSVDAARPFGLRDRAIVWLLMTLGLRASEVAGLTLGDIDNRHASLVVCRRKGGRPLHLPLLPAAWDALAAYLRERPDDTPYRKVFLTRYGRPFSGGAGISERVRHLAETAGLACSGAHSMRRGLGTHLLEQGVGLGEIALILGHESLRCTRQYVRLSMAQLREVADNYAELL